ncbi:MAG TPA: bifunctional enoyl-CoA hydratase/phosphate acetyltransferase [Candidatus Edwardsbacteria bacterium]|nr:bifunctional enoyl-CoA hydratase/phosphate acetyltransferase [Candidatus Edwardsbacteria bacterium]
MAAITTLKQMAELVKGGKIKRVAVACGQDPDIIDALARAVNEKLAIAILIGDKAKTEALAREHKIDPAIFTLVDQPDYKKAAAQAVAMVKKGEADVLMKGLIDTAVYARAYLDKENGLMTGGTVSHVGVFETPNYPRLLIITDAAQIPYPDFGQKVEMVNHAVAVAKKLQIETPKVAVLTATEKVNPKWPCSLEAAQLSKMADRGQIKGCIVDGPLSMDAAVSPECAKGKGIVSPVAGYADILVTPDIQAGNILYKCLTQMAGATVAAMVIGTSAPVILTSRTDTDDAKFYSIVLAALMAK